VLPPEHVEFRRFERLRADREAVEPAGGEHLETLRESAIRIDLGGHLGIVAHAETLAQESEHGHQVFGRVRVGVPPP
jgi:hypothetical protein